MRVAFLPHFYIFMLRLCRIFESCGRNFDAVKRPPLFESAIVLEKKFHTFCSFDFETIISLVFQLIVGARQGGSVQFCSHIVLFGKIVGEHSSSKTNYWHSLTLFLPVLLCKSRGAFFPVLPCAAFPIKKLQYL